jgi:transposase
MTDAPPPERYFVGIDVSKDTLDLARTDSPGGRTRAFANDPAGIRELIDTLRTPAAPSVIVVEATGGLERPLLDALLDAALPVALVNPGNVRHFARGLGKLAKTDALDAGVLAEFARLAEPRLSVKRPETQVELEALVTCRRQLISVRTEQTNRRGATRSEAALGAIDAVLNTLREQIDELDERIRTLIDSDDDMGAVDQLLRSVPGVGPTLSATLLCELAELGTVDRGAIGALGGVAPFNRDSGNVRGARSIRGGRGSVRGVLYMSAIAAMRVNPVIRAFAGRLKEKGKRNKVVIVACMRKLLTILNAMVRDRIAWSELQIVKNLQTP